MQIAQFGDLRPGSLVKRFTKCGRASWPCAQKVACGHGSQWVVTTKVGGKTRPCAIPPHAVEQTRAQIAECQRQLVAELIAVSEPVCHARVQAARRAPRVSEPESTLNLTYTPRKHLSAEAARIVGTVGRCHLAVAGEADFSRRWWSLGSRIARDRPRIKIISRLWVAKGTVVGGALGSAGHHFGLAVEPSYIEAPALPQVT